MLRYFLLSMSQTGPSVIAGKLVLERFMPTGGANHPTFITIKARTPRQTAPKAANTSAVCVFKW